MRWYLLLTPPLPGADNMALDEALLERAGATGQAFCRVYSWSRPTLSLGRNQSALGHYDAARADEIGVDIVRRPTGGRAVLHHREITYAVAAPAPETGSLRESYAAVNRLLHDGLARLGATVADAKPSGRAPVPSLAPCFELPTRDELILDGRKLVGSAQWRENGAFLQHGSILVDDDQPLISRLLIHPVTNSMPAPATLREALGRAPTPAELAHALLESIRALEDPCAGTWAMDGALQEATERLRQHYLDDAWTWRR